jgi:hypothetical protein
MAIQTANSRFYNKHTYKITGDLVDMKSDVGSTEKKKTDVKSMNISVTGHGGPDGCESSRLPHLLDNRLTDGGEVVGLTRRPPFTPTPPE